jgi:acyl-CoA thioesterase II
MSGRRVPAWAGHDLVELLTLDPAGAGCYTSRCGESNEHDRAYGGQVLAQTLMAAAAVGAVVFRQIAPAGRDLTAAQFMFLQGTLHDQPIEFTVTPLQDGRRFTTRHVRGAQSGGRLVIDAQVSFAVPIDSPQHAAPPTPSRFFEEDPTSMPRLGDLPKSWGEAMRQELGYVMQDKPAVDLRLPEPPAGLRLEPPEPRLRFWIKTTRALPDAAHVHAGAFAYLSDYWLNYPSAGGHLGRMGPGQSLYVASLNHAMWLHRPFRADAWLHFDCASPCAATGRSLSVARVHDQAGRLVASATQECLMALREA